MDDIDALVREGRFEEAAELALARSEPLVAAELFAKVWAYDRAIEAAKSANALDEAYRYALAASDPRALAELEPLLAGAPEQSAKAAEHAENKGRHALAARLWEAAGEQAAAATLFERAGELFEAARLKETLGAYREAGVLYEKRLKEAPEDTEAALRLGRILASFGRYEHAVRALQRATDDDQRSGGALRLLVACFAALGMIEAAGACLDRLRRDDPALPVSVPEFLRESFGDERGLERAAGTEELLAGRYRILRTLGAGATGRVVLAQDAFYEREVAVKVLTVGPSAGGRDAYARFAKEARIAAAIDHPNVVRVYEFHEAGPLLVMEVMAGGTLDDRLATLPATPLAMPLPTIAALLTSILRGLEAVHRRGVVHRDLKPPNVFFGAAGEIKIGDFGVAHLADLGATLTGAMLGTLAYMAPEQITGGGAPDASTDFYALGVILYRVLTGALPFPGPDFVTQHLSQAPPVPSATFAALAPYDALVARLLAKDPRERPRTAAEVQAAVDLLPWPDLAPPDAPPVERKVSSIPPSDTAARFVLSGEMKDGMHVARDTILDRTVRIVVCDEAARARYRAWARADSPHLQAVFDIDDERVVLEDPRGEPPRGALSSRTHAELRSALDAIHREALVHGAIDRDHVLVGPGRAVLLLPSIARDATVEDDLSALTKL